MRRDSKQRSQARPREGGSKPDQTQAILPPRRRSSLASTDPSHGVLSRKPTAPPDFARRQVGSFRYLENYRKGLAYQRRKCLTEKRTFLDANDIGNAHECQVRLEWIDLKQTYLDQRGPYGLSSGCST